MVILRKYFILYLAIAIIAVLAGLVIAGEPFGASVTPGVPNRTVKDAPGNDSLAFAGNITYLAIYGLSITQSWQGYFGNVTGVIALQDSDDNIMYNWTLANPKGEVLASRNSSIVWPQIQCFNLTALGDGSASGTYGATNLGGTNLSLLEIEYNISSEDVDGVNETFMFWPTLAEGHEKFFVNNFQFDYGECLSSRIYDNTGPVNKTFEEVLLYEQSTSSVVFTALLEQDVVGFNDATHDFEMLVLENGHGADVSATTYFFYVELE